MGTPPLAWVYGHPNCFLLLGVMCRVWIALERDRVRLTYFCLRQQGFFPCSVRLH